jgi:hypothetical protein
MVATYQKEDSEEEEDAATHSLFFWESKCRDWHNEGCPSRGTHRIVLAASPSGPIGLAEGLQTGSTMFRSI